MSKLSKYLIFIFEESEIKHDVSSNLVRLYMNRFIVDEDAEYEICGIHHIEKTNSKVKDIDKIIATKIDKHERISSKIVSKAAIANDSDVHIITGVPFIHGIPFYYSKIRKLISNKFRKISSYTVLNGYRRQIHSKNYVNHAYKLENEGKPWVDHEGSKSLKMNPDVDLFFHEISQIKFQGLLFSTTLFGGHLGRHLGTIKREPLKEWKRFFAYYKQLSVSDCDLVLKRYRPYLNSFRNRVLFFTEKELDGSYVECIGNRFTYF